MEKEKLSSKTSFLLGLFAGMAIISAISLFILLVGLVSREDFGKRKENNVSVVPNQNINKPQVSPRPQEPEVDFSKISSVGEEDYIRGEEDAPVTIIEFSDFECPFCLRFQESLDKVLKDYQGKVRLVYRHFPLPFHSNAMKAAEAAECAGEQGKFWEMHDKIFEAQKEKKMGIEKWKNIAQELGLNIEQFNLCLDSGKYQKKILTQMNEAEQAGVKGTPTVFVNGEIIRGAVSYGTLSSVIDKKLKEKENK